MVVARFYPFRPDAVTRTGVIWPLPDTWNPVDNARAVLGPFTNPVPMVEYNSVDDVTTVLPVQALTRGQR